MYQSLKASHEYVSREEHKCVSRKSFEFSSAVSFLEHQVSLLFHHHTFICPKSRLKRQTSFFPLKTTFYCPPTQNVMMSVCDFHGHLLLLYAQVTLTGFLPRTVVAAFPTITLVQDSLPLVCKGLKSYGFQKCMNF